MAHRPFVSVVMPARDSQSTLLQCVASLLQQYYTPMEVVLVDHRSSDATWQIMQELAVSDSRISIHQCSGSFVDACNMAWQKASGELIARMDSDDVAYPTRISQQVSLLESQAHLAGCATGVNIIKRLPNGDSAPPDAGYADYQRWINATVSPERIAAERFIDSPIPNPTCMLRREVLEDLGGYHDRRWAEDYDFWLRLLQAGYAFGKVDEILLDWYDGETRATRSYQRYSLDNFQRAKAHYIAQIPLVKERGIVICGAGPTGKRIGKYLQAEGAELHSYIEVNPKQIGSVAAGRPIQSIDAVDGWQDNAVMLSAVGQPEARSKIRELLADTSYIEGHDFFCVA